MTGRERVLVPALTGGLLGGITTAVLARMQREYATRDTLSRSTVVAMYGTYGAHVAALTWASTRRVWLVPVPGTPAAVAGTATALLGGVLAVAGARPFGPSRQLSGVEPGSLHAGGIYRYSRNPQYLGLVLVAAGVAGATRSAFVGLGAAGIGLAYRYWVPIEERHLARVFGDQYTAYQARVRRWLGTRRDSNTRPLRDVN